MQNKFTKDIRKKTYIFVYHKIKKYLYVKLSNLIFYHNNFNNIYSKVYTIRLFNFLNLFFISITQLFLNYIKGLVKCTNR